MAKRKEAPPPPSSEDESISSEQESYESDGSGYSGSKTLVHIVNSDFFLDDYSNSEEEMTTNHRGVNEAGVAEKRLRMAKEYLAKLGDEAKLAGENDDEGEGTDDDEIDAMACDKEILASRLRQDALQAKGKRFESVSGRYNITPGGYTITLARGHKQTPTCVAVTKDGKWAFTGSKGGDIIKWDTATGRKVYRFAPGIRQGTVKKAGGMMPKGVKPAGHLGHVTCLAVSFDGRFVASGGLDKTVNIWDGLAHKHLTSFTHHRGAITGLSFQYGTYQLYSSSADRTVKIWGLDQLAYIDTLFGHQDSIPSIHSLALERCLTVGSRDRTARLWKIPEESQLIFRSSQEAGGSLEACQLLTEDNFVTGSDQGALAIWGLNKKKPFSTVYNAHEDPYAEDDGTQHPIISLSALPFTDVIASGSDDGMLRVWRASEDFKQLHPLGAVPLEGSVNGLAWSDEGRLLVAAVGRDHRLGRWSVNATAQNRIVFLHFE